MRFIDRTRKGERKMNIYICVDQATDCHGRVAAVRVATEIITSVREGYDNSKLAELERDLGKFVEGRLNDAITRRAEKGTSDVRPR